MPLQDWGLFAKPATEYEEEGGGLFDLFSPITDMFSSENDGEEGTNFWDIGKKELAEKTVSPTVPVPVVASTDVPLLTTPLGDVSIVGDTMTNALKIGAGFVGIYFIMKMVK
jgi:hypothetical protein